MALQVGGAEPADLAVAARVAQEYGYSEINLNVGCPSDRVQKGRFGACLMAEPDLVAACVAAMGAAADIPVTVKTRIGIDDRDSFEELTDFIGNVSATDILALHHANPVLERRYEHSTKSDGELITLVTE